MRLASPLSRILGLVLTVMVFSRLVSGEESAAERHFYNGLELMKVEDFSGAVAEFEASLAEHPSANGYYNLSNCFKALHRYGDALAELDIIEKRFADTMDEDLRMAVLEMRQLLAGLVAELIIVVDREGATVQVDELDPMKSPLEAPVILGPGEHKVVVSLSGCESETRVFVFVGGDRKTESFTLKPLPASLMVTTNVAGAYIVIDGEAIGVAPLATPVTLAAGKHTVEVSHSGQSTTKEITLEPSASLNVEIPIEVAPPESTAPENVPPAAAPTRDGLKPVFFIAAVSTTVVFGGLALGMEFAAKKRWEQANRDPMNDAHRRAGNAYQVVGYVSIGFLSAGLIASIVLATQTDFRREKPTDTAFVVAPFASPSGGGLSLDGRF